MYIYIYIYIEREREREIQGADAAAAAAAAAAAGGAHYPGISPPTPTVVAPIRRIFWGGIREVALLSPQNIPYRGLCSEIDRYIDR